MKTPKVLFHCNKRGNVCFMHYLIAEISHIFTYEQVQADRR